MILERKENFTPREERVLEIFKKTNAIRTGHFELTSGRHSDTYVQKRSILPHTQEVSELCQMIAEDFRDEKVGVVAGIATGAIILSHEVAVHLSRITGETIPNVFAEKKGESFEFFEDYQDVIQGERVLVVEDVLTTGGSVAKVIQEIRKLGGEVVGVGALCNRGGVKAEDIGITTLKALINLSIRSWPAEECTHCK